MKKDNKNVRKKGKKEEEEKKEIKNVNMFGVEKDKLLKMKCRASDTTQ